MDSAYDVPHIHVLGRELGHVPLVDVDPLRVGCKTAGTLRYNGRSTVERVNARLKDEFGGRMVRVRGDAKVMCHLMFGILALTANQMPI